MSNGYWWIWWRTEAPRGEVSVAKWFLVEIRNGHASFVHHPKVKTSVHSIMKEDVAIYKVSEQALEKHRQHPENLEPPEFGAYEHVRYLEFKAME